MSLTDNCIHAFFYNSGKLIDLGSLGAGTRDADYSAALGINSTDQVVGYSYLPAGAADKMAIKQTAYVYDARDLSKRAMKNLNTLIGKAAERYWLVSATAINDKGQIVASALDRQNSTYRSVLLTPAPTTTVDGPNPVGNTVAIKMAEYYSRDKLLVVQATITDEGSSGAWATVEAYSPDGKLIGALSSMGDGVYIGKFAGVANNPVKIAVISSLGGSAASEVKDMQLKGR
jgi:uncharacterized membrane protein